MMRRLRRWWVGGDRQDRVIATLAFDPEAAGRAEAWKFIRQVHAEYPNPNRLCSVPSCCQTLPVPPRSGW